MEVFNNKIADADLYLYHYTSYQIVLDYILQHGELRFSPFKKTNDPKESHNWQLTYYMGSPPVSFNDDYNIAGLITNELQENSKIICFTRDQRSDLRDGTLSLIDRGYTHPRMWAQYASNHSGVCLVFNKEKLSSSINNQLGYFGHLYCGNVRYTNSVEVSPHHFQLDFKKIIKLGVEGYIEYYFKHNYKALFFEKHKDWKSESEFRWVFLGESDEYEYFSFENALSGIVLGSDFPEEYLEEIENRARQYRVPIIKLTWINGFPNPLTL